MNTPTPLTDGLWSPPQVAEFLGITTRSLRRLRADDPTFPAAMQLSEHTLRWYPRDVLDWLETRRGRTQQPAAPKVGRPARRVVA